MVRLQVIGCMHDLGPLDVVITVAVGDKGMRPAQKVMYLACMWAE